MKSFISRGDVESYGFALFLKPGNLKRNLKKCANYVAVVHLCDMISQCKTTSSEPLNCQCVIV